MARLKKPVILTALFVPLILAAFTLYNLPPVQERLAWRAEALRARIKYALSPPQEVVFIPQEQNAALPAPAVTVTTLEALPQPPAAVLEKTDVPEPILTPTSTPTPLPDRARLSGVRHEYQTWNNCGPATLSMALSYWGWDGDQRPVAAFTKPNPRDKNVMPEEMAAFVTAETGFNAMVRVGGDLQTLKAFLAAGFPVIVEKGIEQEDGWLGHYVLATGYDDGNRAFTLMDSLRGPDQSLAYDVLENQWLAFNYTYLVVYPAEREEEVMMLLAPHSARTHNYQFAAEKALDETTTLTGRDLYFAWFNRGTNLVALQDYAGAAAAYDQAFALYPDIPAIERPWRMLWYQTGPYQAYFYTERYQDVVDLATTTLNAMSEPVLEESYYWRALAREAIGDKDGAIKDLKTSLVYHPGFGPSSDQLRGLVGDD